MQSEETIARAGNEAGYASQFVTAQDGLTLHVREYGARSAAGVPVVCLPGLSRNSADFAPLAAALAADPARPRRVLALDYRGRGRSEYDPDPSHYSLPVELADVIAVITALETAPAVFVGTSRGGILAMLLATMRPGAIAGCVLNDIGPVIEPLGLMRIKSYVGKLPEAKSFEDAAEVLRRVFAAQFTKYARAEWIDFARRTWREAEGRLVPDYDVRLAEELARLDLERPLPPLWNEFGALARVPVMVVRGANSDVLSAATVAAMAARHDGLATLEVADQGHAPDLAEAGTIGRIGNFVTRCEADGGSR
jgi:pimeloyl-ACP methyl ester carboxylesterase